MLENCGAGDRIRVLDGAFAYSLGVCEGMRDSDRIAILLYLLRRKVRVTADVGSVVGSLSEAAWESGWRWTWTGGSLLE